MGDDHHPTAAQSPGQCARQRHRQQRAQAQAQQHRAKAGVGQPGLGLGVGHHRRPRGGGESGNEEGGTGSVLLGKRG
ncbi:hypothetical protein G6F59_018805 [Rhizopus arrhizus]|nr:hypothetical protein G6F59_018805 [Rhizopus arrhizus]